MKMKIGIAGYGNLGRGVEATLQKSDDMEPVAVFTRREPKTVRVQTDIPVYPMEKIADFRGKLDAVILCGGSANDLPEQTPYLARYFNVVDSFDTHANIPAHFDAVDRAAKQSGTVGIISVGWDPGLFSLARLYGQAVLPDGKDYTFWGKGVSQGHSDAIRRIPGVQDARQYTVPVASALARVRSGENPDLTVREKHTRECFVVAKPGADLAAIEQAIVTMPHYFADYDTTVHFISQEELDRDHAGIPHGGVVLRSGQTGLQTEHHHLIEYRLQLESNPEFTAGVLVAFARAAVRLAAMGQTGCKTVFDIPPALLHPDDAATLREKLC